MSARTERYRFVPFEIEAVNAIPQPLLGGYADVTRGGGMTFERVVFLGPGGQGICAAAPRKSPLFGRCWPWQCGRGSPCHAEDWRALIH
jgi:hypothetical protein